MKTVITFSYGFLQVGTSLGGPATSVPPCARFRMHVISTGYWQEKKKTIHLPTNHQFIVLGEVVAAFMHVIEAPGYYICVQSQFVMYSATYYIIFQLLASLMLTWWAQRRQTQCT